MAASVSVRCRCSMPIVFVSERDLAVVDRLQPAVGDRHAMRVASQILQRVFGSFPRRLGVDDPLLVIQRSQPRPECPVRLERLQPPGERQLAATMGLFEKRQKLSAEHSAEQFDRHEEAARTTDPPRAVQRDPAAGDDAMQMRMQIEFLSPGVQDGEEADLGFQIFPVRRPLPAAFPRWLGTTSCRSPPCSAAPRVPTHRAR